MVVMNCVICESEFRRTPKQSLKSKCCSRKCLGEYNKALTLSKSSTICTHCKKEFHMKKSHIERYPNRNMGYFCSRTCLSEAKKTYYLGDNNPNFKGEDLTCDGYLKEYVKGSRVKKVHQRVTLDYLSLLVIPEEHQIHHRDCNPLNNELDNLALLNKSDHRWLHKNFGSAPLSAYCRGDISLEILCSWAKDKSRALRLLPLNLIKQKQLEVFKLGELLGNPEEDNQQPSQS